MPALKTTVKKTTDEPTKKMSYAKKVSVETMNVTQVADSKQEVSKPAPESKQEISKSVPESKQELSKQVDNNDNNSQDEQKKPVLKPGRTLLVSSSMNAQLNESSLKNLSGLTSSFSTKNGSYFLTFDTIDNSLENYRKLRTDQPNLKVKFSRYQIYFKINGLTEKSDYTAVKQELSAFVESKSGGNVLYFKLYRKGDKFLGCGDLTVDTKDAMDKLLDKDGELKNYTVGSYNGTFFRFNKDNKQQNDGGHKVYSSSN